MTTTPESIVKAAINAKTKKKCLICEKEFDNAEFYFHVQEEILGQLIILNETMAAMKEINELTFNYLNSTEPASNVEVEVTAGLSVTEDENENSDITIVTPSKALSTIDNNCTKSSYSDSEFLSILKDV